MPAGYKPYFGLDIIKISSFLIPRYFQLVKPYTQDTDYKIGEIVLLDGILYQSNINSNSNRPNSNSADWTIYSGQGIVLSDIGVCIQQAERDFFSEVPITTTLDDTAPNKTKIVSPDADITPIEEVQDPAKIYLPADFTNAQLAFMYLTGYWLIQTDSVYNYAEPTEDNQFDYRKGEDGIVSKYTKNYLGKKYLQIMQPMITVNR